MKERPKHIILSVDFFDELALHGDAMSPDTIRALIRRCREVGVDTLYWRVAGLGVAGYPSHLLATPAWLATADRTALLARSPHSADGHPPQHDRYAPGCPLERVLERMDPIAIAREACTAEGLSLYLWVDLFDEQNGRFLIEHPECQVLGRDGCTRWPGLRSYANALAVENELALLRELAAYAPDGMYLSFSCHSRHLDFSEPDDFFGFEPEIAAAYERACGHSLFALSSPEEVALWHRLKGDAFTAFLRRARALLSSHHIALAVGTPYGGQAHFNCPYLSECVKYRFDIQWRQWLREDLADALVLGDFEWPWDGVPNWNPKHLHPPTGSYVADACTPEFVQDAASLCPQTEILLFSSWLSAYAQHHQGASAATLKDALHMRTQTLLRTGAQGIMLHEAHTFEVYRSFDLISVMRHTLDSAL